MPLPILTLLILLPLLGIAVVALLPKELQSSAKAITLGFMWTTFLASLYLLVQFEGKSGAFQFVENWIWIGKTIRYKVGVDGISIWLLVLTTFLAPIALTGAWRSVEHKVKEFCIALLALESAMLGTFVALDFFLFYVFWELMLVPMYLLIGIWGGHRRFYATIKFVLYTMVGSLLMLVAILYIYFKIGGQTMEYESILAVIAGDKPMGVFSELESWLLFGAFALAFAIKVPIFPLHTWLPDAHVEAPTPGSVILAGVLLKMGTYGFLRFAIPMFPEAAAESSIYFLALGAFGVVYGSLVAYAQKDVKKLVAYSSVAHMGLIMMGMFAMTREGVDGAILQMVNHGLSTGALFLCVGFLYERRHTRLMADYGGIARVMPYFAATFVVVVMSSIGVPGTNGFVGELLILAGLFREGIGSVVEPGLWTWRNAMLLFGGVAATGLILGAVYMLTMTRKVLFGPITHEENKGLSDLNFREKATILPVLALILVIGLFPGVFTDKMAGTTARYVKRHQDRMMVVRNPATHERNSRIVKDFLEQQLRGAFGSPDQPQVQWNVGPAPAARKEAK